MAESPKTCMVNTPGLSISTAVSPGRNMAADTEPSAWATVAATGMPTLNGTGCFPASSVAVMTVKNGVLTIWNSPESYSFHTPVRTWMESTTGEVLLITPLKIGYPPLSNDVCHQDI